MSQYTSIEELSRIVLRLAITACMLVVGVCTESVIAGLIPVTNPSFETGSIGEGNIPAGWSFDPVGNVYQGIDNTSVSPISPLGGQYSYIYTIYENEYGYLGQTLAGQVLTANTTYTLSVLVGHDKKTDPTQWPFGIANIVLNAGGTRLATTIIGTGGETAPAAGVANYYTATYTTPATGFSSDALWIGLIAIGETGGVNLVSFDDVTLNATSVPEPSMLALLAVGGVIVIKRRRRA